MYVPFVMHVHISSVLIMLGWCLFSVSDFDLRAPIRIMPFPHKPVVSLARTARLLLAQHSNSLHLVRLGKRMIHYIILFSACQCF